MRDAKPATSADSVIIVAFGPSRHWVTPGGELAIVAGLVADRAVHVRLEVSLLDVAEEITTIRESTDLGVGTATHRWLMRVPAMARHGYGLRLRVTDGSSIIEASSAVEAIEGWWQSPRHAAMTDYEDAPGAVRVTRDLAAWHVNVVQHYDWMWRHYRYQPPDGGDTFVDALGRTVSHAAVRASVISGHECGIASLAYGAVYGAEADYVAGHPDERVFDTAGEPLSLGAVFYINDLRPGSAWRTRLLDEYAAAIEGFAFDGIHMDTYGPPHSAVGADGEALDFAALYPALIDEAAERVAAIAPGTRVLFNCVDGFPLDTVAPAATAALYLELWPPDREFADVVRWIEQARSLAAGRQVVIAAYAATLRASVADDSGSDERAAAFEASLLQGAVIMASGAYHHTLADGDRLLVEGYYPAAVPLLDAETMEMRALWRFSARYLHLVSAPDLERAEAAAVCIVDADGHDVRCSSGPEAGAIWLGATRTNDGRRVLHLVDLRGQADAYWDTPKSPSVDQVGLRLFWSGLTAPVAASPWTDAGAAAPLSAEGGGWVLPTFRRWLLMVDTTRE